MDKHIQTRTSARDRYLQYRNQVQSYLLHPSSSLKPRGYLQHETVTNDVDLMETASMVIPCGKNCEVLPLGTDISVSTTPEGLRLTIIRPDVGTVLGPVTSSRAATEAEQDLMAALTVDLDHMAAEHRNIGEDVLAHLLSTNDIDGLTGTLDTLDKTHERYAVLRETVNRRVMAIAKYARAYDARVTVPAPAKSDQKLTVAASVADARTLASKPMIDGTVQSRVGADDTKYFLNATACASDHSHGHVRYVSNRGCPACQRSNGVARNFSKAVKARRPGFYYAVQNLRMGVCKPMGISDEVLYRWTGELRWHGTWMPIYKSLHVLRDLAGSPHPFIHPDAKSWDDLCEMARPQKWFESMSRVVLEDLRKDPRLALRAGEPTRDHAQRMDNAKYDRMREEEERWDTLVGAKNPRDTVHVSMSSVPSLLDHRGKQPNLPRHPALFFHDPVVQTEALERGVDLADLWTRTVSEHGPDDCRAALREGWASGLVGVGPRSDTALAYPTDKA